MTAQTALIGDYFEGNARSRFMGIQLAATNFGGLIFLLLSGWLAGWSPFAPFGIYAVALLYLPLLWFALPEPLRRDHQARIEMAGNAGELGWRSTLTSLVFLAMTTMVCFYILPTQAPYFLAQIGSTETSDTALFLGAVTLAGGLTSLAHGPARGCIGRARTSALGLFILATGFGLLSLSDGLPLALVAAAFIGVATGFVLPIFMGVAIDIAPSNRRGLAAGAATASIFLGQFLSHLLSQPMINAVGFSAVFVLVAAAAALMGMASLWSFRERDAAAQA